jgi:SAM-dependent methyltransferase
MNQAAPQSPLSTAPPEKVRDLPREFILEQLGLYYQSKPPSEAVEYDYSLWKCVDTGLEFAWPMRAGNVVFYKWISSFPSYYPAGRWEYKRTSELVGQQHPSGAAFMNVLDVGCGKGDFLLELDLPSKNKFALDTNGPAIDECRRHGFNAFCGTIETAQNTEAFGRKEFGAVTSFHCLEHVEDPVGFVRSLAGIAGPGGRIYLSTPYSPMSFEANWFDIMNHPPHHLTRWNLTAYKRLAAMNDFSMRYFIPDYSLLKNAIGLFRLSRHGFHPGNAGRSPMMRDLCFHFPQFARCLWSQLRRPIDLKTDVILIEFTVA